MGPARRAPHDGRSGRYATLRQRADHPWRHDLPIAHRRVARRNQVPPEGAAPVEGSIALDLFAGRAITIDFPGQRLLVESPTSLKERVAHSTKLPGLLSRELQGRALAMSVGVPSPNGPVWMELDTGNGGTVLVAKPYAKFFGLDPDKEGPQQADFPVSADFRAKGNAFTPDMIIDGNLGMPFCATRS